MEIRAILVLFFVTVAGVLRGDAVTVTSCRNATCNNCPEPCYLRIYESSGRNREERNCSGPTSYDSELDEM